MQQKIQDKAHNMVERTRYKVNLQKKNNSKLGFTRRAFEDAVKYK